MSGRTFGAALGRLIYEKRKELGLTQTQLAADAYGTAANVRRISELENGTVANPHPKTIDPIISVLGISADDLRICAKENNFQPDENLDRAYREARNLIEAVAKQFEHTKPNSTIAELDEFLRAKAKEWINLRDRIGAIEETDKSLSNLKVAAQEALSQGRFDEVDQLLSQAEEIQQQDRTLKEVRKQANIRITRGAVSLLKGDRKRALDLYLGAAEFFRPFSEEEMVAVLDEIAYQLYQVGRRSLDPPFSVAAPLLEASLSTKTVQNDIKKKSETHYQLGLIYRNACVSEADDTIASSYLEKAIAHSRAALSVPAADQFHPTSAKIGLGNCLLEKGKRTDDVKMLEEAVGLFKESQGDALLVPETGHLLAYASNSLGTALVEKFNRGDETDTQTLTDALAAFRTAISESERNLEPEVWGLAMGNCGSILATRARLESNPEAASFLRTQAIAAYLSAIETYPSTEFPIPFAEGHKALAKILFEQGACAPDELIEFFLFRSRTSCEIASRILSRERYPERCATIQYLLASIFALHAKIENASSTEYDLREAETHLQQALPIFEQVGAKSDADLCRQSLAKVRNELRVYQEANPSSSSLADT